ncbi:hypothetical protein CFBP5473_04065 [Agrobacterium larrymoorei]|uniref:Uncharacterized protein n=1 Tax=Agrobacterium larrymoorei TaxID=160699 RepID=A0A4D7DLU1_9HYPH|nr:hypothetical protein CFBP5473_04065 [Agrobacterium larrymoorei]
MAAFLHSCPSQLARRLHPLGVILGLDPRIHNRLISLTAMDPRLKAEDDGRGFGYVRERPPSYRI